MNPIHRNDRYEEISDFELRLPLIQKRSLEERVKNLYLTAQNRINIHNSQFFQELASVKSIIAHLMQAPHLDHETQLSLKQWMHELSQLQPLSKTSSGAQKIAERRAKFREEKFERFPQSVDDSRLHRPRIKATFEDCLKHHQNLLDGVSQEIENLKQSCENKKERILKCEKFIKCELEILKRVRYNVHREQEDSLDSVSRTLFFNSIEKEFRRLSHQFENYLNQISLGNHELATLAIARDLIANVRKNIERCKALPSKLRAQSSIVAIDHELNEFLRPKLKHEILYLKDNPLKSALFKELLEEAIATLEACKKELSNMLTQ